MVPLFQRTFRVNEHIGDVLHVQNVPFALSHLQQRIVGGRCRIGGIDQRYGLVALAGCDGAQNVDAGNDSAVIIRGPSDEGEDRTGIEADDTVMMVDALFFGDPAEMDALLDVVLNPCQMNQRAGRGNACLHRPILRLKGRANVHPQPRFSAGCVRKNPKDSGLAMLGKRIGEGIRVVRPCFDP